MDIFEVSDPRRHQVWLEDRQYRRHIQRGHPEMDDPEIIRITVVDPLIITRDVDDDLVEIYYGYGTHSDYPDEWVKVAVRQGRIVTAYVIHFPKREEEVIWTPPNFSERRPRSS